MSVPYFNRQLFSDHWLRERLPQRDDYTLTPLTQAKLALWLREAPLQIARTSEWSPQKAVDHIVALCLMLLGYDEGDWIATRFTLWSQDTRLLWRHVSFGSDSVPSEADAVERQLELPTH